MNLTVNYVPKNWQPNDEYSFLKWKYKIDTYVRKN